MTSPATTSPLDLPDYAPVPPSSLGPALNDQGYHVGRVERNLFWVTDGTYQAAFLATDEGIVLFDAPPTIGHNLRRAIDEMAETEGVDNDVTHMVYSHHHADHAGAADLFGNDLVRIGHVETRRLLLRDNDRTRPAPEVTFEDNYTLRVGDERVELAFHGPNHSPDNIFIHFPDHDALMLIDIVNAGWVPIYNCNLSEDIPGYIDAPGIALTYPWKTCISGHLGRLGTREDIELHQGLHLRHRREHDGGALDDGPDALLRQVRAERVGRREGLPRRSCRYGYRSGGREVHRCAGGGGHRRIHPDLHVPDHAVHAPRSRCRLSGSSLTALR
jgi:glyoxylase-like metal-dependent hydrolase (beta-lactamase superfamily II)